MTVSTPPLISLSCKMCDSEIEGRKTLYLDVGIPSNSKVINSGSRVIATAKIVNA
jgi:hypothetical protein